MIWLHELLSATGKALNEKGFGDDAAVLREMLDRHQLPTRRYHHRSKITVEEARDAAVGMAGSFNRTEFGEALDCTPETATKLIRRLVDMGIVVKTDERRPQPLGRPQIIYRYDPPSKVAVNREKRLPPEREAVGRARPTGPKQTVSGRKVKVRNPDSRRLVEAVREAGGRVETSGGSHLRATLPSGETIMFASTPSDHRAVKNAQAQLRKAGVSV